MNRSYLLCIIPIFLFNIAPSTAQYKSVTHREALPHEIPVYKPGSYAEPGKTYILMNDISSPATTVFLGKDVTLDLNGYAIKYADGNYQHTVNSGFEEGLNGWDLSKAPGAKLMNTADVHVFIGEKLLSLQAGDEITSSYVYLPVGMRSYFAICGVTGRHFHDPGMKGDVKNEMKVSVFVEDENGKDVKCLTEYEDANVVSCPVEKRSPNLGGGFVYAHINKLPAGKYRIRVRADTDCLVDEIDIRPAMDAGIGIAGRAYAYAHYDHLSNYDRSAFFDYTAIAASGKPVSGVPVVLGRGVVLIKNGMIENASKGVMSWGVQSTAEDVKIVLENVSVKTSGINCIAADLPQALITNCRFEVDNPFLINRHGSHFYAVDLRGPSSSEVSFSEFFGGQGCLVFKGDNTNIHHNYFVNNQAVTNHYSIMAMGEHSSIFSNRIEPKRGSGIEIYRKKFIDIFNNTIKIESSAPTCEYGREEYSTAAIRIADYNAKPGDGEGAFGNRVFNNGIHVKILNFKEPAEYIPMSWAVFYSASGGNNDIFGNLINVEHTEPDSKARGAAFYITGGTDGYGGRFFNNRITSNIPAVWLAGQYGGSVNTEVLNNIFEKAPGVKDNYAPVKIGFGNRKGSVARNITFRSNVVLNDTFSIQQSNADHSYSVYSMLRLTLVDRNENLLKHQEIVIRDVNNSEVFRGNTSEKGELMTELPEYIFRNGKRTTHDRYIVSAGSEKQAVRFKGDTVFKFKLKAKRSSKAKTRDNK